MIDLLSEKIEFINKVGRFIYQTGTVGYSLNRIYEVYVDLTSFLYKLLIFYSENKILSSTDETNMKKIKITVNDIEDLMFGYPEAFDKTSKEDINEELVRQVTKVLSHIIIWAYENKEVSEYIKNPSILKYCDIEPLSDLLLTYENYVNEGI